MIWYLIQYKIKKYVHIHIIINDFHINTYFLKIRFQISAKTHLTYQYTIYLLKVTCIDVYNQKKKYIYKHI